MLDSDLLPKNEGVEKVETVVPGEKLIIRILDYHIVNKELLGKNLELSGEKLDAEFAQVLKDSSAVHASKLKLLAGAKEVFIEGLTDKTNPIFKAEIKALKKYHADLKEVSPDDGQDAKELIDEHKLKLLRLNAPGELLLDGVKLKVILAEGPEYELARPKDGQIDDETHLKREEAIVKRIVKRGKTSLLILGGGHDLTEIIKKHEGWGFVRVKPKGYPD
ncbi:hypothetical protein [Anatilimnocola floriformis]|uniref:hypothetical protein n=1 Tax=Anatilimnocola floriformis TaxID=2948575 RepID=UPI0020C5AF98|nr:hypothetical protein [Anatilimnocola floriformis]